MLPIAVRDADSAALPVSRSHLQEAAAKINACWGARI